MQFISHKQTIIDTIYNNYEIYIGEKSDNIEYWNSSAGVIENTEINEFLFTKEGLLFDTNLNELDKEFLKYLLQK